MYPVLYLYLYLYIIICKFIINVLLQRTAALTQYVTYDVEIYVRNAQYLHTFYVIKIHYLHTISKHYPLIIYQEKLKSVN